MEVTSIQHPVSVETHPRELKALYDWGEPHPEMADDSPAPPRKELAAKATGGVKERADPVAGERDRRVELDLFGRAIHRMPGNPNDDVSLAQGPSSRGSPPARSRRERQQG